MGAGNAGASRSIRLNGITVGDKLQGLSSTIGRRGGINYAGSYGNKRDVIFSMNQLGGVGRKKTMFLTGADGVSGEFSGGTKFDHANLKSGRMVGTNNKAWIAEFQGYIEILDGNEWTEVISLDSDVFGIDVSSSGVLTYGIDSNKDGWEFQLKDREDGSTKTLDAFIATDKNYMVTAWTPSEYAQSAKNIFISANLAKINRGIVFVRNTESDPLLRKYNIIIKSNGAIENNSLDAISDC